MAKQKSYDQRQSGDAMGSSHSASKGGYLKGAKGFVSSKPNGGFFPKDAVHSEIARPGAVNKGGDYPDSAQDLVDQQRMQIADAKKSPSKKHRH